MSIGRAAPEGSGVLVIQILAAGPPARRNSRLHGIVRVAFRELENLLALPPQHYVMYSNDLVFSMADENRRAGLRTARVQDQLRIAQLPGVTAGQLPVQRPCDRTSQLSHRPLYAAHAPCHSVARASTRLGRGRLRGVRLPGRNHLLCPEPLVRLSLRQKAQPHMEFPTGQMQLAPFFQRQAGIIRRRVTRPNLQGQGRHQ